MSRAALCLLVLACACDRQVEQADTGPITLPKSGIADLRAASRERKLFHELGALRLAEQATKPTNRKAQGALVTRWRRYLRAAEGTPYADIAAARVQRFEEDGRDALTRLRQDLWGVYIDGNWKAARNLVSRFRERYPGTRAADLAARWGQRIDNVREQGLTSRMFRIGGSKQIWDESVAAGRTRLTAIRRKGRSCHLVQPGVSRVDMLFDVSTVPEYAELRIDHVAAFAAGNEYATVDIAVNGQHICIDLCVASKWRTYSSRRHRWPIGPYLRSGPNVISVRMGRSALAVYWLLDLEVRSGNRPSFESLIDE